MDSVESAINAVHMALEEPKVTDPLAWELVRLWDDLDEARRRARNGKWSIGCDAVVYRITTLTLALGRAVSWGDVPFTLLLDGTYDQIHLCMGINPEYFDVDEVRRTWESYLGKQP